MVVPKSKEEAIELNCVYYLTGIPCQNGHVDKRYTNTDICYACKRERNKRNRSTNYNTWKEISKRTYEKNRAKRLISSQKWAEKNREKSNDIKKKNRLKYREKYLACAREHQRKKREDPLFRLNRNMSKAIWAWLKREKGFKHWETFVGFTSNELIKHLESKFESGMTWGNYGSYWEVDHIKPLSLCETFEEAWQITNLQPLTCSDNRSKGNKYNG